MRHHLAEYFIRYLLASEGTGRDLAWFNSGLGRLGLPPLEEDTFDEIRGAFVPPRFFNPRDPLHRMSMNFLREQRIYSMFFPGRDLLAAQDLLHDRLIRDKLETVLLGRHNPATAARLVNKAVGTRLRTKVVSLFQHYFFQVGLFTNEELALVLYDPRADWKISRWAQKKAALWGGPEVAAMRAGVSQRLDSRTIMTKAQHILYCSLLETDEMPNSPQKVSMLRDLVKGLALVDERLASGDTAIQEILEHFRRFRLSHQGGAVLSVETLGGRHSGSDKEILELGPAKVNNVG